MAIKDIAFFSLLYNGRHFWAIVVEANGYDNFTLGGKDCRNYIDKIRRHRCRTTHEYFGEFITFDIACLTNKYDMHFDTKIFSWPFTTWLECMHECAPNAIIIDQDIEQ
ncbi:hypothetical protein MTR_5g023310 [Medicago truncatula]|uniref:Uncharacterized protein n=1 Tax=Medicago truncatula TaxID=3880 RepID=G7JYU6_MEDTR|nr:hypothetical protein MTR_5g023310 [Medicago truncatula]